MECRSCKRLLSYQRGSKEVKCSSCHTLNLVRGVGIEETKDCVIIDSAPTAPILLDDDEEGTPLSGILCLKTKQRMESIEKREACFILDFDPSESSIESKRLSFSGEEDVVVIREKGEVACRDYKHARHDCGIFPFGSTPHSDHCDKCCCRICQVPAPCAQWISSSHCDSVPPVLFFEL